LRSRARRLRRRAAQPRLAIAPPRQRRADLASGMAGGFHLPPHGRGHGLDHRGLPRRQLPAGDQSGRVEEPALERASISGRSAARSYFTGITLLVKVTSSPLWTASLPSAAAW